VVFVVRRGQINEEPTHLTSVRPHVLQVEHGMRGGVGKLIFLAFLFSFLLLLYQQKHLQSLPNLECSVVGVSRDVSFDLPDNVTLASLNITGRAEVDILFFNRVPKVGSTSIQSLLDRLASQNGFKLVRDTMNQVEMVTMDRKGQEELANRVMAHPEGSVFSKHVAWVDFAALGHPSPIYVNMVREPVERLVSWFYYIRAAWYILDRKQAFPNNPLPSSSWVRKTFDTCVADPNDMECKYPQGNFGGFEDHRRQSIFFCGHHQDCVPFNSERANQLAKRVVEEHYAVVKNILICTSFLVYRFLHLCKYPLISGWCLGRNEQNTCSVRSLYATTLSGG